MEVFPVAEYVIVVQDEDEKAHEGCVYVLDPRTPFLSKRRESAFWKKVGEEVAERVASAGLPFEAVMFFLKKARRIANRRVSLCAIPRNGEKDESWRVFTSPAKTGEAGADSCALTMTEDERLHFEEARLIAEEIAKRNRDMIPDMEDEIITPDEFEDLIRGDASGPED